MSVHDPVIRQLEIQLHRLGSANDAEDHGYLSEARRIGEESCKVIRRLIEEEPSLTGMFPSLQDELESRHILGFGWRQLLDLLEGLAGNGECS